MTAVHEPSTPPATWRLALLGLFLGAFAISFAFSWVPGPWLDEGVTLLAMQRSWGSLIEMFSRIDVVHATYYVLQHVWGQVWGVTLTGARASSALAVGVGAVIVALLGRRLVDARVGLLAGATYSILPSVTWMGSEARSPAMAAAATALVFLLLLVAMDRAGMFSWLVYSTALVAATYLFVFNLLSFIALPLVMLAGRQPRAQWLRFGAWTTGSALITLPLGIAVSGQQGQVSWIPEPSLAVVASAPIKVWFFHPNDTLAYQIIVALLVVGSLLLMGVGAEKLWPARTPQQVLFLTLVLSWLTLPLFTALAVSWAGPNIYVPRYVMNTTPALALLLGAALRRLGRGAMLALPLLAMVVAPAWLAQRAPLVKLPTQLTAQAVTDAGPADAVLFLIDRSQQDWTRLTAVANPEAFTGLRDLTLGVPFEASPYTREQDIPLRSASERLQGARSVVAIVPNDPNDQSLDDLLVLIEAGFSPQARAQVSSRTAQWEVVTYRRAPAE